MQPIAQRYGNGDSSVHLAQPDQVIRDDAGEQQHRPNRKIDAAADNDECFSDCEDAQDREITQRVAEIVHRRKARRSDGKQDNQRDQRNPQTLSSRSANRRLKAICKRRRLSNFRGAGLVRRFVAYHDVVAKKSRRQATPPRRYFPL